MNGETYINEFCAGSYEDAGISDLILNIDQQMGNVTSEYMCTDISCPCPNSLDLSLYSDEEENNKWGRTIMSDNTANYELITKQGATDNTTSFVSFMSCYEDRKD